ncbi:MAG: hypothetical protein FWD57_13785, partial [Polyangiaceae bacterium]|nr:hypothetical protein [Polyangiaceae bacterium]
MKADEGIRIGVSTNANATAAIDEICDQTYQEDAKLTAFFCSSYYDLDAIASRMRHRFPGTNVIGCTTAGEVGPGGYINRSISAFSLGGPTFDAVVQCVDDPARYPETEYRKLLHRSAESMHARGTLVTVRNTFGFLVLGGMSCQEEYVVSAIYGAAGDVPGFGGSAGDDFRCIETYV